MQRLWISLFLISFLWNTTFLGTCSSTPYDKLSMPITSKLFFISKSARLLPINPATPVIRIFNYFIPLSFLSTWNIVYSVKKITIKKNAKLIDY